MFRNQNNPEVRLEQNCELNSKIPGKCLFSLKAGQFGFGKLKTGICENKNLSTECIKSKFIQGIFLFQ